MQKPTALRDVVEPVSKLYSFISTCICGATATGVARMAQSTTSCLVMPLACEPFDAIGQVPRDLSSACLGGFARAGIAQVVSKRVQGGAAATSAALEEAGKPSGRSASGPGEPLVVVRITLLGRGVRRHNRVFREL